MKKKFFNRIVSFLTVLAMIIPMAVQFTVSAEETEKYPYAMFGRNGIVMTATSNMCVNGAIHTNKAAEITAVNKNINGKLTTGNDIEKRVKHVYADTKIYENYFTENCDLYEEEYVYSELNIHINNPLFCYNNITLNGNVSFNSNLGTLMNLNVTGEVKNANSSVVYSKYGDITIENDSTANINGLIYAPLGTLTINSPNVTINGIIIADKVVINSSNVNINYNDNVARFIGTTSEVYDFSGLEYLPEEWLGDTDEDDLFDIYEKVIDTDPLDYDTDDDALPDGYEVITLGTDPLEIDTDGNGVSDADEDFDTDNLTNFCEYQNGTEPFNPDTDDDGYLDGDEVHKYGTLPLNPDTDADGLLDGDEGYDGTIYAKSGVYFDPLNPDTDGDGILDGDEAFAQRKQQAVETHDKVITEITVDMITNGNLERNLTIESMYNIDAMTTNVNALVGEPFNFETPTSFEEATITFKIDKAMLGEGVEFDNLIILWYNEEKQIFEEMDTTRSWEYSTISTTTTHFSQYMIVDSQKWYEDWENCFTELRKMWIGNTTYQQTMNTIFIVDCGSSMLRAPYGDRRLSICRNIINNMLDGDKAAAITYANTVEFVMGFNNPQTVLYNLSNNITSFGSSMALVSAFDRAMNMVYNSSADINRIVILTTSGSKFTFELDGYDLSNVTVNVIDLGDIPKSLSLENVTQVTGGDFYTVADADELTYQHGDAIYTPPEFVGVDTDGDTIPDIVEKYGLLPNGVKIGTNPNSKDTDGDGLDDNVEINFSIEDIPFDIDEKKEYDGSVYVWSDPNDKDTDDDGFKDGDDIAPLDFEYVNGLEKLCDIAIEYMPNDFYNSQLLVLQTLRYEKYNDILFDMTCDSINNDFISYLKEKDAAVYDVFIGDENQIDRSLTLTDPITGTAIDFNHFAATLNAYYYKLSMEFMPCYIRGSAENLADIYINEYLGWLGDYLSMIFKDFTYEDLQKDDAINDIKNAIGVYDRFEISDVIADFDAVNIYYMNSDFSRTVSDALNYYYRNLSDNSRRFGNFAYNLMNNTPGSGGVPNATDKMSYKESFEKVLNKFISYNSYFFFNSVFYYDEVISEALGELPLLEYTGKKQLKHLLSNEKVINNSSIAFADYVFESINSCGDISGF